MPANGGAEEAKGTRKEYTEWRITRGVMLW